MKKLLIILFALMLCIGGNINSAVFAANPQKVKVIQNSICIYQDANILSEVLMEQCNYGTELLVDANFEHEMFFKVSTYGIISGASQDDYGFVLKAYVLDSTIISPSKTLQDNAKIKNDETFAYTKVGDAYQKVENIVLSKGTKIQILDGYDSSKPYTLVCFSDQGTLVNYYVETKNIQVYGVNYSIIVAIMTLVTVVAIVSIIFGFKAKKKAKNKKA